MWKPYWLPWPGLCNLRNTEIWTLSYRYFTLFSCFSFLLSVKICYLIKPSVWSPMIIVIMTLLWNSGISKMTSWTETCRTVLAYVYCWESFLWHMLSNIEYSIVLLCSITRLTETQIPHRDKWKNFTLLGPKDTLWLNISEGVSSLSVSRLLEACAAN